MTKAFIEILNMSLLGGVTACGVIFVRLLLKKAPKKYSYMLWAVVLFRLLCPFSIESVISLLPMSPTPIHQDIIFSTTPAIHTDIAVLDNTINTALNNIVPSTQVSTITNPMQTLISYGTGIWLIGIVVMLVYAVLSYGRLKIKLIDATLVEQNIFESDKIATPFVLGLLAPRIYLPLSLPHEQLAYIVEHERTHIQRKDYLIKLIAFFALSLHWFNPLALVSYKLMAKDMEMSCDENVLQKLGGKVRFQYSKSLLELSARQSGLLVPLAFGESNTKSRVKNVLGYKKPAIGISIFAIIIVAAVVIGLAFNRTNEPNKTDVLGNKISADTAGFIYGDWTVAKFLGFTATTKDDVEWPDGEKIIGKSVQINDSLFSSLDFGTEYSKYAVEIQNPSYEIRDNIEDGSDFSKWLDANADESIRNLTDADHVLMIQAFGNINTELPSSPALYIINNNRLLLSLNCDYFELAKKGAEAAIVPSDTPGTTITVDEAKELFKDLIPKAAVFYGAVFNGGMYFTCDENVAIPGAEDYTLVTDERIKSTSDLKAWVAEVFSPEVAETRFYNNYMKDLDKPLTSFDRMNYTPLYYDYGGKLYADSRNGGHGFAFGWRYDTTKITEISDDHITAEIERTLFGEYFDINIVELVNLNGHWFIANDFCK